MIYGEIENYLPASLRRSSFARPGSELDDVNPNPNPGLPMRRNISAQCNPEVAGVWIGYVWMDFIGVELG